MKIDTNYPRRDMLKLLGTSAVGLASLTLLGGCERFLQQLIDSINNRPIRRYIRSGNVALDQDIQVYRDAVAAMKALPSSDPRSWIQQANIHLNHCPHGGWFFLPWHRAYLHYFERICRELTGVANWGLPYWNWSTHPSIPAQFWGASSNPLFHSPRSATSTSTASSSAVGPPVIETILSEPNFLLFAGGATSSAPLEYTPHNHIHGFIGGTMGTFNSPRDPVFWTHHNMIDCIWTDWNINRGNGNTNDPAWINHNFTGMFVDEDGNSADIEVLTTILMPFLSYRFESSQKGESPDRDVLASKSGAELRRIQKRLEKGVRVKLDYREQLEISKGEEVVLGKVIKHKLPLKQGSLDNILGNRRTEKALLNIGDIELPKTGNFFVRVFINEADANPTTPINIPSYAGSFYFFVDAANQHHGHHKTTNYIVDITDTLRKLNQSGNLDSKKEISIQLVPIALENRNVENARFTINQLNLGFSKVQLK